MLANVFRAWRWQLMINPVAKSKVPLLSVFNALMLGYLVNLALPRAGELARCAWLAKKEHINTAELIGTVVAERIFDVLVLFALVLCALFLFQDLFINLFEFDSAVLFTHKSMWIASIIAAIFLLFIVFFSLLIKKKHPLIAGVKMVSEKFWSGVLSVKRVKDRLGFTVLTLAIWFFYVASNYFAFKMLHQTELLSFSDAILCVVAGSFGMIAPIQGGIGAFHFMVTKCLTFLGTSSTPALVFATVLHASQTLVTAIFGLLALLPKIAFTAKTKV